MSASFEISSSTRRYGVTVQAGLLQTDASLRATLGSASILADEFFRDHPLALPEGTLWVAALETEKSLDRAPDFIERMRAAGVNRGSLLLALGGGILQDISAFVASVYMRGLRWVYVPTTVLAMVDSCIGGKSSINVGPYKNLVGTYHPPEHIYIDPSLAETLPRDQFASGLIEAAKICFCRGPEAFAEYLAAEPSNAMPTAALERVIVTSLQAKKHFIEIDEFDHKERLLLNFGHTFGHALEGASHYAIPHGIAVGLGILCSLAFQRQRGVAYQQVPRVAVFEQHLDGLIRSLPDLRAHLGSLSLDEIIERLSSDKKHTSDNFTLILVAASGAVELERIPRSPALLQSLRRAIHTTLETYTQ